MTEKLTKESVVFWQTQDDGVPEPAIAVEPYGDIIVITQDGDQINLNYDSIGEFCKLLKSMKRPDNS